MSIPYFLLGETAMTLYISYLFPILAATGILCFFAYYIHAMTPRKGTLEWIARAQTGEKKRFTFSAPLHRMQKKDALPLLLLTVVYAATAFWSLGNTKAPQSYLNMKSGDSVTFTASGTVSIGRIEYYTGLWTGSYELEFSSDGVNWESVELKQAYSNLFYWLEPEELPEGSCSARYFCLTATCSEQIEIGELAIFDTSGNLVTVQPQEGAEALFDEQNLAPKASHWTNSAYFDEIYHARTAFEHLRNISPYEDSHPPLGKLFISIGIALFGMTPFGWRFIGTLFGVLMVPLIYVFLKNLFGKTVIALCGAALFTFDFMHLTQTRIATIDSYGVFFILAMFFFLYRWLALPAGTPFYKCALPLFLSGLMFGIGIASKWIVVYGGVGLAVLFFLGLFWKCRAWPQTEDTPHRLSWVIKTILFCILTFVIIPLAIYLASYLPIASAEGLSTRQEFLKYVWDNQVFMLTYHQGVDATHPYSSRWYQWILDIRPILYYMVNEVEAGFTTRFAAFNNPIVSWAGLAAIIVTAVQTIRRRCGKGLFIVIGYLAQLLPWVFISRTTFAYHYFPSVIFLCLALAYVMNDLIESGRKWKPAVYGLTGSAVGLYALFYPVLVGIRVPTQFMKTFIKWFPSWPF